MVKLKKCAAACMIVLSMMLAACGGGGSGSQPPGDSGGEINGNPTDTPQNDGVGSIRDTGSNNFYNSYPATAILYGAVLGDNQYTDDEQTRSLPVSVESVDVGLVLEQVYASRDEKSSANDEVVTSVVVRNVSQRVKCSIKVAGLHLVNADGSLVRATSSLSFEHIEGATYSYVDSLGVTRVLRTCLAAGERGYINASFRASIDDIGGMQVSALDSIDYQGLVALAASVVPVGYSVDESNDSLTLTIENQGSVEVLVKGIQYIFLAADGLPLYAHYSRMAIGSNYRRDEVFAPGERKTNTIGLSGFHGQATQIRVILSTTM